MDELESQIAKICLGNFKQTKSFVFVLAEKAGSGAETYMVAELPLLNPAAAQSHEKICESIASALKRAFRQTSASSNFENALGQINEELGKLASMGQTNWVDKLNCILAVKEGQNLQIATVGKVCAFMFRNGEFTDISCSPARSHPLKTFENYATGKIRLGDLLIFSTSQLFNYLAMNRMKEILLQSGFLTATQSIIELLKENGGPETAFGTLLNLQVPPGQTDREEIDLENYIVETPQARGNFLARAADSLISAFSLNKPKIFRRSGADQPGKPLSQKLKSLGGGTKQLVNKSKLIIGLLGHGVKTSADRLDLANFKNFSRQKKLLFISAVILLIALAANVGIAIQLKKTRALQAQISLALMQSQNFIDKAQSALLYKNESGAQNYLASAQKNLPDAKNISAANRGQYQKTLAEINDLRAKIERVAQTKTVSLGNIGNASRLIKLPGLVAAQAGNSILSYDLNQKQLQDGLLKSATNILAGVYAASGTAAVYDGNSLLAWDYNSGQIGAAFTQNVPAQKDFAGIAFYPDNKRVYVVDRKNSEIFSFLLNKNAFSKPVASVNDPGLSQAEDLAVDGSVYVFTTGGAVNKYQAGKPMRFILPHLTVALSGQGKIYTQKDYQNIYILDAGNNRIVILDKKGGLVNILKNDQFTKLKDFIVDEPGKTIYLLNDTSLLQVTLP